jgi:hypothetical protein
MATFGLKTLCMARHRFLPIHAQHGTRRNAQHHNDDASADNAQATQPAQNNAPTRRDR